MGRRGKRLYAYGNFSINSSNLNYHRTGKKKVAILGDCFVSKRIESGTLGPEQKTILRELGTKRALRPER